MDHLYADCGVSDTSIHDHLHADRVYRTDASRENYLALERVSPLSVCSELQYAAYVSNKPKVIYINMEDALEYLSRPTTYGVEAIMLNHLIDLVLDNLGNRDDIHSLIWDNFSEDVISVLEAQFNMDINEVLVSDAFNRAMQDLFELGKIIENYVINARLPLIDTLSFYKLHDRKRGTIALTLRTHQELFDDNL